MTDACSRAVVTKITFLVPILSVNRDDRLPLAWSIPRLESGRELQHAEAASVVSSDPHGQDIGNYQDLFLGKIIKKIKKLQIFATRAAPWRRIGASGADSAPRRCGRGDLLYVVETCKW